MQARLIIDQLILNKLLLALQIVFFVYGATSCLASPIIHNDSQIENPKAIVSTNTDTTTKKTKKPQWRDNGSIIFFAILVL